jgi:hypothetical protein
MLEHYNANCPLDPSTLGFLLPPLQGSESGKVLEREGPHQRQHLPLRSSHSFITSSLCSFRMLCVLFTFIHSGTESGQHLNRVPSAETAVNILGVDYSFLGLRL